MKNLFSYITQGGYGITSGPDSIWLASMGNFISYSNSLKELPWCPILNALKFAFSAETVASPIALILLCLKKSLQAKGKHI